MASLLIDRQATGIKNSIRSKSSRHGLSAATNSCVKRETSNNKLRTYDLAVSFHHSL